MARYPRNWPPLVQILAVLGIIALMTAILFPAFQRVKENTNHDYCPAHMKQLILSLTEYSQDNDDTYPASVNSAGNGWAKALYPFTKNVYVYHCPNDTSQAPFISYAENRNLVKQQLMDVTNPAATVALYETTTLNCDPAQPEAVSATGLIAPQDSSRPMASTSRPSTAMSSIWHQTKSLAEPKLFPSGNCPPENIRKRLLSNNRNGLPVGARFIAQME